MTASSASALGVEKSSSGPASPSARVTVRPSSAWATSSGAALSARGGRRDQRDHGVVAAGVGRVAHGRERLGVEEVLDTVVARGGPQRGEVRRERLALGAGCHRGDVGRVRTDRGEAAREGAVALDQRGREDRAQRGRREQHRHLDVLALQRLHHGRLLRGRARHDDGVDPRARPGRLRDPRGGPRGVAAAAEAVRRRGRRCPSARRRPASTTTGRPRPLAARAFASAETTCPRSGPVSQAPSGSPAASVS